MKTTIDLPDDVFFQAKLLAAERRTTLRELMIQGLRQVMSTPAEEKEKQRRAALKELLNAMKASNSEPMVPLKREEIHDC